MNKALQYSATLLLIVFSFAASAATKTWVGGASGSWTVASNWSPSGMPVTQAEPSTGDDIIFDGSLAGTVTITNYPVNASTALYGSFSMINNVTLNISGSGSTWMYFGVGINIAAGCTINVGYGSSFPFSFGNRGTTSNSGLVYGTVKFEGPGQKRFSTASQATFGGRTHLYGDLVMGGPLVEFETNTSSGNFYIESGGELQWNREGMALPGITCQDGGVINVTGVVAAPLVFNNFGNYYGLIIWNCPGQTAQNIGIVPSVGITFNVDSVRVVSHGTGSVTLGVTPCYYVGHVELMSGVTLALGRPSTAPCTGSTILTDVKLNPGSTLIGNGTYTGDVISYPLTVTIGRNLLLDNATLNLTNRPAANSPGGAMDLRVTGSVTQTNGGTIFTGSSFGSQNTLTLSSATTTQDISISTLGSGTYALTLSKTGTTTGASLAGNLTIPSNVSLVLNTGQLALNNYTLTVPYNRLSNLGGTPFPRIVTNGTGKLKLTGIPASATVDFPVSALKNPTYEKLTLTTTAAAGTHDYSVRVGYGNMPGGIYSPNKTIRRTWVVNASPAVAANQAGLTFQYADSAKGSSCNPAALMEEGHFAGGVWNVDPSLRLTPTGSNPYTVGPFYPNSLDSSFVIGNQSSILEVKNNTMLKAVLQGRDVLLSWSRDADAAAQSVEHSTDGYNFGRLAALPAVDHTYADERVAAGTHYYRVKTVAANGDPSYSNVVKIVAGGAEAVSVSPSVVRDMATVYIHAAGSCTAVLKLSDAGGKILLNRRVQLYAGLNKIPLDPGGFAAGVYYLQVMMPGSTVLKKVVKL